MPVVQRARVCCFHVTYRKCSTGKYDDVRLVVKDFKARQTQYFGVTHTVCAFHFCFAKLASPGTYQCKVTALKVPISEEYSCAKIRN